jgi:hypothetical protein
MKTVSSIVENYIKTKPFLLGALSQNIINLTSLARNMMKELEHEFDKDVKQGAIVMALKRLSVDLDFRLNHRIVKLLKNIGEITVRSSLCDFTFAVSDTEGNSIYIGFMNADSAIINEDTYQAIQDVFEQLSPDNQQIFHTAVNESAESFERILNFVVATYEEE